MKNIIGIKKEDFHYNMDILGKKFKIYRFLKILKNLDYIKKIIKLNTLRVNSVSRGNIFLWENEDKLTYDEKVWFISQQFYERLGYFPDLENPKTFNEKLNWMKLHYDNPNETRCIDKYEFKNYIKEKLGEGYTIPLLGVWESVDEIEFDKLPKSFLLKTNWGGGGFEGTYIIKDKSSENIDKIKYLFNDWLQPWENLYYSTILPGYKNILPKIIAEKYLPISNGMECRAYCFHGKVKFVLLKKQLNSGLNQTCLTDADFNIMPFVIRYNPKYYIKHKPECFDKVIELSEVLSKDFPFVRVDFMICNEEIYVGELTFIPCGGYNIIKPVDWDTKLGEWLDLSKLNKDYIIN